ncbi:LLM class flavin-dependent oxidoreductase [Cellulomonas sp. Y8]|uniref:LLM class flavin-dependent oxidoreductase n=1 Tax=Cellulomonas sp. Y8 TaxID=2591145 RepID=UPI003D764952
MSENPRVPLSVLDLAVVPAGGTGTQAVRAAVDLAVDLDRLGYHRVWYAEHHLSPGVGSASPAVLAAAVAARTERIRVGSGAVLLSTTSPLVAAEQFGTIAALHPGRVDLGLGRAFTPPGGTRDVADTDAVRGDASAAAPTPPAPPSPAARPAAGPRVVDGLYVPGAPPIDGSDSVLRERLLAQKRVVGASRTPAAFRDELGLVLGLRAGDYAEADGTRHVAPPVEGADFDLWVLASSAGESARVAGELGLPIAANFHVSPATTLDTIAAYRAAFRPGVLDRPYVVVSADVLVAGTTAEARALAAPFADWVLSIRRGAAGAIAYPHPDDAVPWEERDADERALVADRVDTRVVGAPADVVARLETLQRVTGADELLITTATHDPADARRSFALLAEAWGVAPAADATPAGADRAALTLVP